MQEEPFFMEPIRTLFAIEAAEPSEIGNMNQSSCRRGPLGSTPLTVV
jgi:hypothetical protein